MEDQRWTIRRKLLTGFVGLAVLVVIIMLVGTGNMVENRIREDINTNFREAGRLFERIQEVGYRQMRQTAILLADYPVLKAAISTGDTATVNQTIRDELRYLLDVNPVIPDTLIPQSFYSNVDSTGLLMITDPDGIPLGQMANSPLPDHSIADRPGVANALDGEGYPTHTNIWKKDGRYFNMITVPIWTQNMLVGTLSYGFPIRQIEVEQLARDFDNEVSYYVDNQLLATSFTDSPDEFLSNLAKQIHNATYNVIQKNQAATFVVSSEDEETWMVYVAPMQKNVREVQGIVGYYAIAKSLTNALSPLNRLQWVVILIGIGAVAIAIVISVWITGRITKPIRLLSKGIERIEDGDYNQKVPVITRDELGQLTRTFNNLVQNLRERLMMIKFVSEATHDAITSTDELKLGGHRQDLTVFFSDIRGFTSWSEKREPEQVIEMLNTFLRFQAEIVQDNNGDIDKYVGDELVAVFHGDDKEQHAVNAAIEIQQKSKHIVKDEDGDIAVGIGINTGEVVMGAMGSEQRMDYTVLGNNVNLGARLCSAADPYQILISQSVNDKIERRIPINELKPIMVKGIKEPIPIYEIDLKNMKAQSNKKV